MHRKRSLAFPSLAVVALVLSSPSFLFAQAQEILEDIPSTLHNRPTTFIVEIQRALQMIFEGKDFQEKKTPFAEFVREFEKAISKKGKEIEVIIERDAFRLDLGKCHPIAEEKIILPPVPAKFVAATAFRIALAQVGQGKATCWIRQGQLVITSHERAASSYFLKTACVATNGKHTRLVDLLDDFAEETGVSIIVDARMANQAQTKVTAECGGKLETMVRLLSRSVGLAAVVMNNIIYVTSPDNAKAFKSIKQKVQLDGYVSLAAHKHIPLAQALNVLGASTSSLNDSGWIIDRKAKRKANIRVAAKWHNYVPPDAAICILTDMAGLRHVVIDQLIYITTPADAKMLEALSIKNCE